MGKIIEEDDLDELNNLINEIKEKNKLKKPFYIDIIKNKINEEKKTNPNLENEILEKYSLEDIDSFILLLGEEKLFKNAFLKGNYKIFNFKSNVK